MASTSAMFTAASLTSPATFAKPNAFLRPLTLASKQIQSPRPKARMEIRASTLTKEHTIAGLTATALTVLMVVPDIAEAAQPGISPSLKNFLLSILSGGVVVGAIAGAVIAVSNFDPVKRS